MSFPETYKEFCKGQGKAAKMHFFLEGKVIALSNLWQLVSDVGGSEEVTKALLWHGIAEELLSSSQNTSANAKFLREVFSERLAEFERLKRATRISCFLPQPALTVSPSVPEPMPPKAHVPEVKPKGKPRSRSKRRGEEKSKRKKSKRSSRYSAPPYSIIPTATIIQNLQKVRKGEESASTPEPEAKCFKPKVVSSKQDEGKESSVEAGIEAQSPAKPPVSKFQGSVRLPSLTGILPFAPRPPQQVTPLLSSGFQPLMVTHEAQHRAPNISTGPQIRPMIDPFTSISANGRLKARMAAAISNPASFTYKAPPPQPSLLGPLGAKDPAPNPVANDGSGFKPLTVPSKELEKAIKEGNKEKGSKLGRHVNRHTMLTAKSPTSANVPMLEVLADLDKQREEKSEITAKKGRGRPKKKKAKQVEEVDQPEAPLKKRMRRTMAHDVDPDEDEPTSRQSSPYSTITDEPQELDTDVDFEDEPGILKRKLNASFRDLSGAAPRRSGRTQGSIKIQVKAHAPEEPHELPELPKLPKRRGRKLGPLRALREELANEATIPNMVAEIRRAAVSFSFPIISPVRESPRKRSSIDRLEVLPLKLQTSLNPLIQEDHTGKVANQDSPTNKEAAQEDLSESGKVKLTEPQTRFLAHVRGQCWLEEPQESIFSTKSKQSTEPVNRRSTRTRTAPIAFSPCEVPVRKRIPEAELDSGLEEVQAILPECQPRPPPGSQPKAEDAHWVSGLISRPGDFGPSEKPSPINFVPHAIAEKQGLPCWYSYGLSRQSLLTPVQVKELGLSEMGLLTSSGWTGGDVSLFEQGINAYRRDFRQIAITYLPSKGTAQVCSFYYNLWKSRAIPQARRWYKERDEAKIRAAKEAEARILADKERILAAKNRKIADRQQQLAQQVPFTWLKSVARQPHKIDWARYQNMGDIFMARNLLKNENMKRIELMHLKAAQEQATYINALSISHMPQNSLPSVPLDYRREVRTNSQTIPSSSIPSPVKLVPLQPYKLKPSFQQ